MTIKTLAALGTSLVVLGIGTALWAQKATKPQKKDSVIVVLHNDFRVLQESSGVAVLIDVNDEQLRGLLQEQVETILRQHRVPVLSPDEVKKGSKWCYLEIDVNVDDPCKTYYSRLAYSEVVGLLRKSKTLGMMIPLYDDIKSGLYTSGNTDGVKKIVVGQVERFCDAFRKANPTL